MIVSYASDKIRRAVETKSVNASTALTITITRGTIAMATSRLASLLAERQHAVFVLAKQAAIRAVRRKIQKEGRIKLWTLPLSTITRLADEHLRQHPELYAEALASDRRTCSLKKLAEQSRTGKSLGRAIAAL